MPNELDNRFQEALGGYESPVDKDALWLAVRPTQRKRRFAWLWLLALALCASGAGAGWWLAQDMSRTATAPASAQTEAAPGTIHTAAPKDTSGCTSDAPTGEARTGVLHTAAAPPLPHPVVPATKATTSVPAAPDAKPRAAHSAGKVAAPASSLPAQADGTLAPTPAATAQADMEAEVAAALPRGDQALYLLPPADMRPLLVTMDTAFPLDTLLGHVPPTAAALDARRRRSKHRPWSVTLAGGYHASLRQLTDTPDGQWASLRAQSEQVLEARSFDVLLGYQARQGWHLRGGLGYSAQHTRFDGATSTIQIDTIIGITRIELSPAGDTTSLTEGPIARYRSTRWRKRTYNTATFLEVPLLAGYTLRRGLLDLCLEGGLRLALTRRRSGDILDATGQVSDWAETAGYRTGLLWRVQAGATVGYALTAQWHVGLGAQVIASPAAWTSSGAGFREGYQWLGVRVSVARRW